VTCIVNYWPKRFRALYGGGWPDNYCAIDTETSGWSFDRDVITEWGHVLVQGGEVVDRMSVVIDWSNHEVVPDNWLRSRLAVLKRGMEQSGQSCHMTYERMRTKGVRPDEALPFVRDFLLTLLKREVVLVAHNGTFDEKMLAANLVGFGVAKSFTFGDNGMLDTDCIEKAGQAVEHERMHPRPNDTLRSYFHRVKYTNLAGVKSNLSDHCFRKYDFAGRHGIDRKSMHGAEQDAFCTHLLMGEFRSLIRDGPPQVPPTFTSTQSRTPARPKAAQVPVSPREFRRLRGQRRML
jgi:DNA polymerase III epsilon subunit-like protein